MDRAVAVVRLLLGVVALTVLTTQRLVGSRAGLLRLVVGGLLVALSFGAWWLPPWLRDPSGLAWRIGADLCLQIADTLGFVLLVAILGVALPDVGWAVLVLPIVTAALRFGPKRILLTWAACSVGYVALLYGDYVTPRNSGHEADLAVQHPKRHGADRNGSADGFRHCRLRAFALIDDGKFTDLDTERAGRAVDVGNGGVYVNTRQALDGHRRHLHAGT